MAEQIEQRVATLEEQVKSFSGQETKIDKIMELIYEVKMSIVNIKHEGMSKSECQVKHIDYETRFKDIKLSTETKIADLAITYDTKFDKIRSGQTKIFWSTVTATFALVVWLIQMVFNLSIKVGG
jgi:hypothetical protein